jgi:hypothetical protein
MPKCDHLDYCGRCNGRYEKLERKLTKLKAAAIVGAMILELIANSGQRGHKEMKEAAQNIRDAARE